MLSIHLTPHAGGYEASDGTTQVARKRLASKKSAEEEPEEFEVDLGSSGDPSTADPDDDRDPDTITAGHCEEVPIAVVFQLIVNMYDVGLDPLRTSLTGLRAIHVKIRRSPTLQISLRGIIAGRGRAQPGSLLSHKLACTLIKAARSPRRRSATLRI